MQAPVLGNKEATLPPRAHSQVALCFDTLHSASATTPERYEQSEGICCGLGAFFTQRKTQPCKRCLGLVFQDRKCSERPSRYKTCKILFRPSLIPHFIFFIRFASYPYPVHTTAFSCPSLVLFPPKSGGKEKPQVTQSGSWGCPTLNLLSKPQFGHLIPAHTAWAVRSPAASSLTHSRAQRSCFQLLHKKHPSSPGTYRWKSSSVCAQGQHRGHSLSFAS